MGIDPYRSDQVSRRKEAGKSHSPRHPGGMGFKLRFLHGALLVLFAYAPLSLMGCGGSGSITTGGGGTGGNPGGPGGSGGGGGRRGGIGSAKGLKVLAQNDSSNSRNQVILASVPFPEGAVKDLSTWGISGLGTAWRILQRWGDGSVRIAQAQFLDTLKPFETKTYEVVDQVKALTGPFVPNPWVDARIKDGAPGTKVEVVDEDGVVYTGTLEGPGETLHETYLVRTRFWRFYCKNPDPNKGIGRDFLTVRVYRTEFRDMPFVKTDVVVGNDYLGADDTQGSKDPNLYPLGPVSFKEVRIGFVGVWKGMYHQKREGVGTPLFDSKTGYEWFSVLKNTWLDDGQTKLYSFVLYFEAANGDAKAKAKWQTLFGDLLFYPVRPLATLATWQKTWALGLLGGPVTGPTNAYDRAESAWVHWKSADHFGPWGKWGDVKFTNTTGTPRNGPFSEDLGHAIQGENPHLLEVLEGKARIQAVRQYHMWGLEVGERDNQYLWDGVPYRKGGRKLSIETRGRFQLLNNDPYTRWRRGVNWKDVGHGWNQYDHEHFTTDFLFDYYTVTGSFWARDELRILGQCLKGLMRLQYYFTQHIQSARAEGWTLSSFIQCWLATGDPDLKDYALKRIKLVVDAERPRAHASKAFVFQWNHPLTKYPTPSAFFMPWQHGPVMLGYLAAYRFWGSKESFQIVKDVVHTIEYSWVKNYKNDPNFGNIADGLRYYVPAKYNGNDVSADFFDSWAGIGPRWGDSPLGGAHEFLLSGLYQLIDTTTDKVLQDKARYFAGKLLGTIDASRSRLWNKWTLAIPDRVLP